MLSLSFQSLDPAAGRLELVAANSGPNIVFCRLVTVSVRDPADGAVTTLHLRPPPDALTWDFPNGYFEPGSSVGLYVLDGVAPEHVVSAEAHYTEFDRRATV